MMLKNAPMSTAPKVSSMLSGAPSAGGIPLEVLFDCPLMTFERKDVGGDGGGRLIVPRRLF